MNIRRMGLNAVIFGLGSHEASWRMPESNALASTDLGYWIELDHQPLKLVVAEMRYERRRALIRSIPDQITSLDCNFA